MSCSVTALQSFPIGVSIPTTIDIYNTIIEPLLFNFTWESRSTPPQFANATNGQITESSSSSLIYLDRPYNLESVQITDATHNAWVVPTASRSQNSEDIILTFSFSNLLATAPKYIIIIIPIIRSTVETGDPAYLNAFNNPTAAQKNISLASLIPNNSNEPFAYYTTCFNGTGNTPSQNILNIVSVKGILVSSALMTRIKTYFTSHTVASSVSYGQYIAPIGVTFSTTPTILDNQSIFTKYVKVTNNILTLPDVKPPIQAPIVDSVDAYKCVELDPENHIIDGKLTFDPDTGIPLKTVESERLNLINDRIKGEAILTPDIFIKYVSTALGMFFTIIILLIIIYFFMSIVVGSSVTGNGAGYFQKQYTRISSVPSYLIIGTLCLFTGFMTGMIVKYR